MRPAVAVFGSSEPRPGSPAYTLALEVGRAAVAAGYDVLTGGYGGVMEAASRGAREAGGRAIGVVSSIFERRAPNAFLSETVVTADLHERTRALIERAAGFVVLEGRAGTLAELALLWALHRAGCLAERPVVLLGDSFKPLLDRLESLELLDRPEIALNRLARTPAEAIALLGRPGRREART